MTVGTFTWQVIMKQRQCSRRDERGQRLRFEGSRMGIDEIHAQA